jgi:hypothetical protein
MKLFLYYEDEILLLYYTLLCFWSYSFRSNWFFSLFSYYQHLYSSIWGYGILEVGIFYVCFWGLSYLFLHTFLPESKSVFLLFLPKHFGILLPLVYLFWSSLLSHSKSSVMLIVTHGPRLE